MTLEWLAHSCFCLKNDEGHVLVMDPYNEEVGYQVPALDGVDIVSCSHGHMDHANLAAIVNKDYVLLEKQGNYEGLGFSIQHLATYHDDNKGAKRGENLITLIETEGIRLCHCGDLGHLLSAEQVQALGKVDVLIIPVGGLFTIDAKQAAQVVDAIGAKIVIPMHYAREECRYDLAPVEDFLEEMKKSEYAISMYHDSVMKLDGYTMPKRAKVYVMESKY